MKQIINNETGEIIEVEEDNELVEKKLYEVGAIDKNTFDFLEQYQTVVEQYEIFKYKLMLAMKENNIKSWKNDYFTATYKEEGTRKSVDIDRLKKDGLYDNYLKLSTTKESLMIKFRKEK